MKKSGSQSMSLAQSEASGLDGFSAAFYQQNRTSAIEYFFQTNRLPKEWNTSAIIFIPKHNNVESPKHLHPTNHCNSLYKIASKILATRWKRALGKIIEPNQYGFISGRDIVDNIMVTQEIYHSMQRPALKNSKWFLLQLDMEKAFDRIGRDFLKLIMRNGFLGFCQISPFFISSYVLMPPHVI